MKILLDIDDTAILTKDKGKTWFEHSRLKELIKLHNVFLYSGNPEIEEFAAKWKVSGFFPKGNNHIPKADVLIDNDVELWIDLVDVKKTYKSINSFFRFNK
ncbi:MAG: hypothetical protein V3V16_10620 [Melioribacteraceae bacterium]